MANYDRSARQTSPFQGEEVTPPFIEFAMSRISPWIRTFIFAPIRTIAIAAVRIPVLTHRHDGQRLWRGRVPWLD